jgi:hypothetical protein
LDDLVRHILELGIIDSGVQALAALLSVGLLDLYDLRPGDPG